MNNGNLPPVSNAVTSTAKHTVTTPTAATLTSATAATAATTTTTATKVTKATTPVSLSTATQPLTYSQIAKNTAWSLGGRAVSSLKPYVPYVAGAFVTGTALYYAGPTLAAKVAGPVVNTVGRYAGTAATVAASVALGAVG